MVVPLGYFVGGHVADVVESLDGAAEGLFEESRWREGYLTHLRWRQ